MLDDKYVEENTIDSKWYIDYWTNCSKGQDYKDPDDEVQSGDCGLCFYKRKKQYVDSCCFQQSDFGECKGVLCEGQCLS